MREARVRIEGSHEVVELIPGGREAASGWDADAEPVPSRLTEWWRAGPPREWRLRARDRLNRGPARSAVQAVERIPRRARVMIALIAIAAAGFVALGLAAGLLVRDYLMDRAEAQLASTSEDLEPALHSRSSFYLFLRPLPDGIEAERRDLDDGEIRKFGGFDDDDGSSTSDGPELPAQLPASGDRLFTVPDRADDNQWLVQVTPETGGDDALVVATEIGPAHRLVGRLTELAVVIGALAVAAMAFVTVRAARSNASTLTEMAQTVEAAVAGDTSRRLPEPAADTEPAQVARAVNTLLEQIDDARRAAEQARRTVGEAGEAMRQPLNVIQGFTAFYHERPGHDPERMARLVDRVGDEAARIELVVDDLVSDMSRTGNGSTGNGSTGNGSTGNGSSVRKS
jgi:two-component system OmpR family sensor kinase